MESRVGPDTILAGYRISGQRRISGKYRISGRITRYTALKIRRISGIRIVSISGIQPVIENGRISGWISDQTGYPAQPNGSKFVEKLLDTK